MDISRSADKIQKSIYLYPIILIIITFTVIIFIISTLFTNHTFENKLQNGKEISSNKIKKVVNGIKYEDSNHEINVDEMKINNLYQNIVILFFGLFFITLFISILLSKRIKSEFIKYSILLEDKILQSTKEVDELNKNLEKKFKIEIEKSKLNELRALEKSKFLEISEMIENIAHQWRQPLNVISVVSSGLLLKFEMNILNKNDAIRDLETLSENTLYLSNTIESFKNSVEHDFVNVKTINIKEFLKKTFEEQETELLSNSIFISSNIDDIKLLIVKINTSELETVINNIITNAKEALLLNNKRDNRNILVHCFTKEEELIINIADNAGGIPEDIITKVFDPYFTTKHKSIGTGVGLYHSKRIIEENLKGSIQLSNNDEGLNVTIVLNFNEITI